MRPNTITYKNQIQIWLISILIMLTGSGLSILFSMGSNSTGFIATLLPVIIGFIAILFINPYFGFVLYFNFLFLQALINRYFPEIPISLVADVLLIFTVISLVVRLNKANVAKIGNYFFLLCILWYSYQILYAGLFSNSNSELFSKLHGYSFYTLLLTPLTLYVLNCKERLNSFFNIVYLLIIISTIWALKQLIFGSDQYFSTASNIIMEKLNVNSVFSNSLIYGSFMAFAAVICFSLIISPYGLKTRLLYTVLFLICLTGIFLSGILLPYLILFAGVIAFLAFRKNTALSIFSVLTFLLICCVLFFTELGNQNYQIRKLRAEIHYFKEPVKSQKFLVQGAETKSETLALVKDETWQKQLYSEFSDSNPFRNHDIKNEGGIFGFLIYIGILIFVLITGYRKTVLLKNEDSKQKLLALLCGFSGLAFVGSVCPAIWQAPIMVLSIVTMTLIISAEKLDESVSLKHLKTKQS